MYKVKIIDEEHELDLEDAINEFLEELEGKVMHIQYQVSHTYNGREMEYSYSCLILYEEDE